MKKMSRVTMLVTAAGAMAQPRYDRYDDRRYDDRRSDDRYDDGGWYDDRGGRDFGVSVQVYNAPPPPPPMAYRGFRPACPGPNFVWVDGFWNWRGNGYGWRQGYWAPRPHARAFWVSPRYDRGRYFSGYWGGFNDRGRGNGRGRRW
jgi:hypothetical protein